MNSHFAVPIGSAWWWAGWLIMAVYMILALSFGKKLKSDSKRTFEKTWAILILLMMLYNQYHLIEAGRWSIKFALPLEMCGISRMLCIAYLLTGKRAFFLPLLFWGWAGGIHSFLTPELTMGNDTWQLIEYYISHAGVTVVPTYAILRKNQAVLKYDWIRAFGLSQLLMILVGSINYLIGANYMYLLQPPIVNNPFIMGPWPFYLIGFELAAVVHFWCFEWLANKMQSKEHQLHNSTLDYEV